MIFIRKTDQLQAIKQPRSKEKKCPMCLAHKSKILISVLTDNQQPLMHWNFVLSFGQEKC